MIEATKPRYVLGASRLTESPADSRLAEHSFLQLSLTWSLFCSQPEEAEGHPGQPWQGKEGTANLTPALAGLRTPIRSYLSLHPLNPLLHYPWEPRSMWIPHVPDVHEGCSQGNMCGSSRAKAWFQTLGVGKCAEGCSSWRQHSSVCLCHRN